MSKGGTSPEPRDNDEQRNVASDSLFQREGDAKRAALSSLSGTKIQDLPNELVECILTKAVVMEVREMKLIRRVWREKADLAISRLASVCSQWTNILTTNFFRNQVHRILDDAAHETIRLEILHQSQLQVFVLKVTTLRDDMFALCRPNGQDYVIYVYDRNNMAAEEVVKDVIRLPGMRPNGIVACALSNCVYMLNRKQWYQTTVERIQKDDERHQFTISAWKDLWLPNPTLSVTSDGSVVLSRQRWGMPTVIIVYGASGSILHQLSLSNRISSFSDIIPKRNGNLFLVSVNRQFRKQITEIDMRGTILRQFKCPIVEYRGVCRADIHGRFLITDRRHKLLLLDSEFNLLEFTDRELDRKKLISPYRLHYNCERNEILSFVEATASHEKSVLTIFRFTEE